jgi:hypothetical protein
MRASERHGGKMEIKRASQKIIGSNEADSISKEVKINAGFSLGISKALDSFEKRNTNTMTSGESSSSNEDVYRYRLQTTTTEDSSVRNESSFSNYGSVDFAEPQKTAAKATRNLGYHPYQTGSEQRSKHK